MSSDFGKLRAIIDLLTPGLVFANDGGPFARALYETVPTRSRWSRPAIRSAIARPRCSPISLARKTLQALPPHRRGSGPTPSPNSVHVGLDRPSERRHQHPSHVVLQPGDDQCRLRFRRRRAAGPGGLAAVEPHLRRQPQLQHGAHNGGTLYIDDGNPTPPGAPKTARNLREIAPTIYFNVPQRL